LAKDSWGAQVIPELGAQPNDLYVDKHRISGFWDSPLDSILRQRDIRTVAFMGVNSDECVFATLLDASFHGYDTIMIEDGTATSSPASCHEAALYQVRFCFGFTVTSQDWVASMP
jgi:nicotinamidase-related amidase